MRSRRRTGLPGAGQKAPRLFRVHRCSGAVAADVACSRTDRVAPAAPELPQPANLTADWWKFLDAADAEERAHRARRIQALLDELEPQLALEKLDALSGLLEGSQ